MIAMAPASATLVSTPAAATTACPGAAPSRAAARRAGTGPRSGNKRAITDAISGKSITLPASRQAIDKYPPSGSVPSGGIRHAARLAANMATPSTG